jgi:catalase
MTTPDDKGGYMYPGYRGSEADKRDALEPYRDYPQEGVLTTDQGIPIPNTDDSLKAGQRGPTLLEDFHFREKITQFDHERIPERVVHARGSGAHGYFQVYESLADLTRARFLHDPAARTPVFVRFSTVVGSRGSADTVRDVRGFAVKFYTDQGNFDLVGNNIPVFFIQDGIKFPDIIHAAKPEPHNEIPQAQSAHDTFWDFVSLVPETMHMVMWVMSDRAIPRSFRMMEGFGVHTFRLVNEQGKTTLVKFHWKPLLGVHSLVWDEAQKLAGKDPDYHRRDLWNAIAMGAFPEYELGLQIMQEDDALRWGFDLLDSTKVVPEELVPVRRVGKLTLHRNVSNFFAETEQVAFCTANLVPGIEPTDDPLMQSRLHSYLDTQLTRLGGPNFEEIPINRPVAPVHNHQQDGSMRQRIPTTRANYHPNSIEGGCPVLASMRQGYTHSPVPVSGARIRERSPSFSDHFSQAALFYDSLTDAEKRHLLRALQFELGKVERQYIRERVVGLLANVDMELARTVALGIGVAPPPDTPKAKNPRLGIDTSPSLSMDRMPRRSIATRRIAVLIADGFSGAEVKAVRDRLEPEGAVLELIAPRLGLIKSAEGGEAAAQHNYLTASSVFFDAAYVPGGRASVDTMLLQGYAASFVREAYHHAKPIGASAEGIDVLIAAGAMDNAAAGSTGTGAPSGVAVDQGVVTASVGAKMRDFAVDFMTAILAHRHWDRDVDETMPV